MMKLLILLFLLSIGFCARSTGTWPLAKKQLYFQWGFYTIPPVDRLHFSPYKTRLLHRHVLDVTVQAYAAYGISNKWTVSVNVPFKFVATSQSIRPSVGLSSGQIAAAADTASAGFLADFSNVALSVQYLLWRNNRWVFSGHYSTAFPTAIQTYNQATKLRTAYPCFSFYPHLSAGYSYQKLYTSCTSGIQFRSHNYAHQWIFDYEIGWKIGKKFCLAFQIATVYCWPGKPDIPQSTESIQTGLYINNQNYVALNIKSMIEIKANWGIQISIGGGLWANNVQQGPSLGLGFYYKSVQN